MEIPIISGVTADETANFRQSMPVNLEPVIIDSGISKGTLSTAPGITAVGTGPGRDRGSIVWNGVHYRVMGSKLVSIGTGGVIFMLGDVGDDGKPVSLDYSFDLLGIASAGGLYYLDGGTVNQVTDPDLGLVIDMLWIDGRFMTTDGQYLVVTELNDPYSVDPLKYGSSEVDPDPILALRRIRGEVYAINQNTIENFRNIGGTGFPYQRNSGALIPKGAAGTKASCYFLETFAFVGGGRNEAPSVYLAGGGEALPISTPEIDRELAALSDDDLNAIEMESRQEENEARLYIHLPNKSLVYVNEASKANQGPVWYVLAAGVAMDQRYPIRHLALANGKWVGGTEAGALGFLDAAVETHFGAVAGWRFDTLFLYNEARGGIIHSLELIGLPGRAPFGDKPTAFMSTTKDGETWSQERAISTGEAGQRGKRVQWRPNRRFSNYVGMRFRGANTAVASWAKLNAEVEPLAV